MPELPTFRNPSLLRLALTHRPYHNQYREMEDNERFEFLGNALLSFLSSAFLHKLYPDMENGELNRRRAALVDEKQLAKFAAQLGIGTQMRLFTAEGQQESCQNEKLLSKTFEAIIGAYCLDSGIDAVRLFLKSLFDSAIAKTPRSKSDVDFKALFGQWSLLNFGQNPQYFTIEESGSNDAKQFTAAACVGREVYGVATEFNKHAAEKMAAEVALKKLGLAF